MKTFVNVYAYCDDRFEAEISGASLANAATTNANSMFIPHQLRPVVCANTYSQVQQKLQQHPPTKSVPMLNNVPPPPIVPSFVPTFMSQEHSAPPEKSYSSEPTPVVLSSAPKLYTNRLSVNPSEKPAAPQVLKIITYLKLNHRIDVQRFHSIPFQIDISSIQFDVSQKLKKLKTEKMNGPNPIAEAAIQAAKASSALQNFQLNDKRKKDKKVSEFSDSNPPNGSIFLMRNYFECSDGASGGWPSLGRRIIGRLGSR